MSGVIGIGARGDRWIGQALQRMAGRVKARVGCGRIRRRRQERHDREHQRSREGDRIEQGAGWGSRLRSNAVHQNSPITSPPATVSSAIMVSVLMFSATERTEPSTSSTLAMPLWNE